MARRAWDSSVAATTAALGLPASPSLPQPPPGLGHAEAELQLQHLRLVAARPLTCSCSLGRPTTNANTDVSPHVRLAKHESEGDMGGAAQLHGRPQTSVCFSQNSHPVNKACEVNQRWRTCKLASAGSQRQIRGGKKNGRDFRRDGGRPGARHAVGDTPYWQAVQECSAVGADHGRAPERRGGGLFSKPDFRFQSRKKKSCSRLRFVSDRCRLSLPARRTFLQPPGKVSAPRWRRRHPCGKLSLAAAPASA